MSPSIVIGGGNSAGQAAVWLARSGVLVTLSTAEPTA